MDKRNRKLIALEKQLVVLFLLFIMLYIIYRL
jgi:hypothetical protein